jgi:Protein of unknown function (DUF2804)
MSRRLPWRGPAESRPDLPLPPAKMPRRRGRRTLKRWRYVGVFADEFLLCAARVQVGSLGQTFWVVWDREDRKLRENTRLRLPGGRGEVWREGREGRPAPGLGKPPGASLTDHVMADGIRARLRFGDGEWVEAVCPTPEGQYVWTRKRAGVPVECDVRVGGKRWQLEARGVEDESAGYHPRHTVWNWSSGLGRLEDGRSVGWSLVTGVNDPPERSERAIWIDGEPSEPGPVEFDGLDAIRFDDGARLDFGSEAERTRDENRLLVRYSYRQPLGVFSGSLPGGLRLDRGLGVMEHHDAHW